MISDHYNDLDEIGAIDTVENIAEQKDWDFDRVSYDQIAIGIQGEWCTYSITVAETSYENTLRLILTFDFEPPEDKKSNLYETLNLINDQMWLGHLTYWEEQQLIVFKGGHKLNGEAPSVEFLQNFINDAVVTAERFYPALQLTAWADSSPAQAMKKAIATPRALRLQ